MHTITDIAATAADRFDMDQDAAKNAAREYLRQVEVYDGEAYDEDHLTGATAEFILGSIQAGQETTAPTELDEVSHLADQIADVGQGLADLRQNLHRAVLAAATAGHPRKAIAAAAGVSVVRVDQILRDMRAAR